MKVLRCLAMANLGALLVVWALERAVGERCWLTTLLAYAPQHPLGIPSLLLLVWAAARRDRRALLLSVAALAFFAFALLGLNVPLRLPGAPAGTHLRVMTFNIRSAWDGLDGVVEAVQQLRPDVLCLQEADIWSATIPPLDVLPGRLPGYHSAGAHSLAVLSLFPITGQKVHAPTSDTRRFLLEVTLDVDGRRLSVLTAHFTTAARPRTLLRPGGAVSGYLSETGWIRARQAEAMLEITGRMSPPFLVAGDLNTPPRGRIYHRLARALPNAFATAGWGFGYTYRSDLPVLRIDHLFVSDGIHVARCWVPRVDASDHRPVVAEVVITR